MSDFMDMNLRTISMFLTYVIQKNLLIPDNLIIGGRNYRFHNILKGWAFSENFTSMVVYVKEEEILVYAQFSWGNNAAQPLQVLRGVVWQIVVVAVCTPKLCVRYNDR